MPADHDSAATMSRRGGGRPERGGLGDRGAGAHHLQPPGAGRARRYPAHCAVALQGHRHRPTPPLTTATTAARPPRYANPIDAAMAV